MTPMFEQVDVGTTQSSKVRKYSLSRLNVPYHYHPEIEMVLILKSTGKVFVRNAITTFEPGDLFLFGSNVPHIFIDHRASSDTDVPNSIELIVIQLHQDFITHLLVLPEFSSIKSFLKLSDGGIKFAHVGDDLINHILDLHEVSGLSRLMKLISLLHSLQRTQEYYSIDKLGINDNDPAIPDRLQQVGKFLQQNYNKDITLEMVSEVANMNKTSFCRYFKEHTRRTFSQYLNELRIDYASKLLIEGSYPISRICYEVGYNNPPYFMRQFKKIHGVTPKQYRLENQ